MVAWLRWMLLAAGLCVSLGAHAVDLEAGSIWSNGDARGKCPRICGDRGYGWDGNWHITGINRAVCSCKVGFVPPLQGQGRPGEPVYQGPVVRYDRTDLVANDLPNGRVNARSFEDCAQKCLGDRKCVAVTYNTAGSCYKKSGVGQRQENASAISGVITARGVAPELPQGAAPGAAMPAMPGASPTPLPGFPIDLYAATDLPGNDIGELIGRAGSVAECARRCVGDRRCTAFTYNNSTRNCVPKSSAAAGERNEVATSGLVVQRPVTPEATTTAGSNSCSSAGTARCPACSITCDINKNALCLPTTEGANGVCDSRAACKCQDF